MLKTDVIKFFGNGIKTARALGVTKSAVSQWPDIIPEAMAYRAQAASKRKLKVDAAIYLDRNKRIDKNDSTAAA